MNQLKISREQETSVNALGSIAWALGMHNLGYRIEPVFNYQAIDTGTHRPTISTVIRDEGVISVNVYTGKNNRPGIERKPNPYFSLLMDVFEHADTEMRKAGSRGVSHVGGTDPRPNSHEFDVICSTCLGHTNQEMFTGELRKIYSALNDESQDKDKLLAFCRKLADGEINENLRSAFPSEKNAMLSVVPQLTFESPLSPGAEKPKLHAVYGIKMWTYDQEVIAAVKALDCKSIGIKNSGVGVEITANGGKALDALSEMLSSKGAMLEAKERGAQAAQLAIAPVAAAKS